MRATISLLGIQVFLAKQIMSKSSQKKSSGLPWHYPPVTFCLLSSCTPNSRQGCSRALYLGTNILPFLWKHLNWYVLFVRLLHLGSSQSSWDQQIHPDSSLLLSFPTSLQQRFLFTLPKHTAVYFLLLNFIPFLMCQHAVLTQLFQKYRYSSVLLVLHNLVPSANAVSSLLPFVPRPAWEILREMQGMYGRPYWVSLRVPAVQSSISESGNQRCAQELSHCLRAFPPAPHTSTHCVFEVTSLPFPFSNSYPDCCHLSVAIFSPTK